jgi:hypothetical protein
MCPDPCLLNGGRTNMNMLVIQVILIGVPRRQRIPVVGVGIGRPRRNPPPVELDSEVDP